MTIKIDETDLNQGVLGLVIAIVEVIRDTLKVQALRVMDSGVLDDGHCGRLGRVLLELETALEDIKKEPGIAESARAVRDGLDGIVDDMVNQLVDPAKWPAAAGAGASLGNKSLPRSPAYYPGIDLLRV
jgi:hypothetical protein